MEHLGRKFDRLFDVQIATNQALIDEALRLRYQVYCLETGFEDATCFPDGREYDRYDVRSVHTIIQHKPTEHTAATARLILPSAPDEDDPLPMEVACLSQGSEVQSFMAQFPKNKVAEVSRFCVSKEFKQRYGEQHTVAGFGERRPLGEEADCSPKSVQGEHFVEYGTRVFPFITLGLFSSIIEISAQEGIEYWYALMEPSLLRLWARFGIILDPLGDPVELNGWRQPSYGRIDDVLSGIKMRRPDVWRFITKNGSLWPEQHDEDEIEVMNLAG